jgi:hypothetical protein
MKTPMKCERCGQEMAKPSCKSTQLVEVDPGVAYTRQEIAYCHECGEKHLDEELGRGIR